MVGRFGVRSRARDPGMVLGTAAGRQGGCRCPKKWSRCRVSSLFKEMKLDIRLQRQSGLFFHIVTSPCQDLLTVARHLNYR
jgi:hypothetical protein